MDVRPEISYKTNTIKGAINIPVAQLRTRLSEIPKDKNVIVFCVTGYTSYVASRILSQNGFNNVYSLVGGFEFYRELTRKVEPVNKSVTTQNIVEQNNEIIKIDASGLQCPGPILKVAQNLETAKQGTTFQIISTDRGFKSDIGAWCKTTGNTLLNLTQQDKKIIATVCKGQNKTIGNKVITKGNGQTIVVFSNDLDKALASFIIANGAKASGKDVTMFFTFWGLNILRKSNIKVKKSFKDTMFGFMMPKGAEQLKLSKMNFGGLGTMMMKSVMKNKNISTLNELISQAQQSGIKFIACQMSMDVMGIKEEELIDGVEIGGVAKYIAESSNANSNLFI
jgi:peroxiredoxin family protein/TusA-related sulfurtransferase/rhodanese-related sulfurtransferase